MEAKYKKAILAGIVAGIAIVLLLIVYSVAYLLVLRQAYADRSFSYIYSGQPTMVTIIGLVGYLFFFAYCLILMGVGILAVRTAAQGIRDIKDAAMVAAIAGATGGIVWGLGRIIIDPVLTYLVMDARMPYYSDLYYGYGYQENLNLITIVIAGIVNVVCCLPASILIGITAALIGGVAYAVLFQKKTATA